MSDRYVEVFLRAGLYCCWRVRTSSERFKKGKANEKQMKQLLALMKPKGVPECTALHTRNMPILPGSTLNSYVLIIVKTTTDHPRIASSYPERGRRKKAQSSTLKFSQ